MEAKKRKTGKMNREDDRKSKKKKWKREKKHLYKGRAEKID